MIFQPDGKIAAMRHAWDFDEMYSAFAVQGLGKNGQLATKEQLAPIAKTNVEFFGRIRLFHLRQERGQDVDFGPPRDYSLEERPDKLVVLIFTVPLKSRSSPARLSPFRSTTRPIFVDFSLAKNNPVALASAPKGCSIGVLGANPLDVNDAKKCQKPSTRISRPARISA